MQAHTHIVQLISSVMSPSPLCAGWAVAPTACTRLSGSRQTRVRL